MLRNTLLLTLPLVLVLPLRAANSDGESRRILTLANGQVIRVLSRETAGGWQYKAREGWKDLEANQVVHVTSESEALAAWNKKSGAIDRKKIEERVGLARYGIENGLVQEALLELDAVLTAEPDYFGARELLTKNNLMNVPSVAVAPEQRAGALDLLFRWAAPMPPAARELAVNQLGKFEDHEALRTALEKELRSNIVLRRSFGALALRRLCPKEALRPLVLHSIYDASEEVRTNSALALKASNEPGVVLPLVRVIEDSPSPALRSNAAESLGVMGYANAVEPIVARLANEAAGGASSGERLPHSYIFVGTQIAYVQDFDVQVAQFQAVADPQINTLIEGSTLETAVMGVQQVDFAVEQATMRSALEKLTRASPGKTTKDWLAWWKLNGDKWMTGVVATQSKEQG